jgi:hypothetical protein
LNATHDQQAEPFSQLWTIDGLKFLAGNASPRRIVFPSFLHTPMNVVFDCFYSTPLCCIQICVTV